MQPRRTFFVTARTSMGQRLFQVDRDAGLLVGVLRCCVAAGRFEVHDFVVMPDHIHLLISVGGETTVEKAMQFVKGGFSYRVKKEMGFGGEVWQRGFSDVQVRDPESFLEHRRYIAENPVRAGLVGRAGLYRWCFEALRAKKAAGAKARESFGGWERHD